MIGYEEWDVERTIWHMRCVVFFDRMEDEVRFQTQYDEKAAEAARKCAECVNNEPSLTVQGPAKDADINELVKRFGIDRDPVPPAVFDPAYYGDVTDIPDLGEALRRVAEARDRFMALPHDLRRRFDNDPSRLWEFVNDVRNVDEAVRLGLLSRQNAPETTIDPQPISPPQPSTDRQS